MTNLKQKIRVAIIGYGISGKLSHALPIQANPEFSIVAVCDLSEERRQQAKTELGCEVYESHKELFEQADPVDLACVITRSDTHCAIATDCLNAGMHTLITKPWALNRREADQMLAAQRKSGKRLFPWMPMSWSPEFLKIRELIRSGAIGDVFLARRYVTQFWRRSDWQTEQRFGGGYLLNWGMHIVQPILELIDSPVKRVSGQLQQTINPGDADDNFQAAIEFENGTRGIAEFTEAIEGLPSFMIQGTRGMIRSDEKTITLLQKEPDPKADLVRSEFPIEGKVYGDEIEIYKDLAHSLLRDTPFKATLEAAYQGTLVLDAIRESSQSGRSIALESDASEPSFAHVSSERSEP